MRIKLYLKVISVILIVCSFCSCTSDTIDLTSENPKNTSDEPYSVQSKSNNNTSGENSLNQTIQNNKTIPDYGETSSQSEYTQMYVTGTSTSIAMQKEASYYSESICHLICGDCVDFIRLEGTTGYSYVYSEEKQSYGYINNNYLTEDKSAVCPAETYYIRFDNSNIYSTPDENGSICKTFNIGDTVTAIAKTSGGYWRIKPVYEDIFGYIPISHLSESLDSIYEDCSENDYLSTESQPAQTTQSELTNNSDQTSSTNQSDSITEKYNSAVYAAGGTWSIYIFVPETGENITINETSMQAASLIKLYIMGAVYEKYDTLSSYDSNLDSLLYQMITISDNSAANTLIQLLGEGDYSAGMQAINDYCSSHGFHNTSINRLLLQPNTYGDNYTSTGDCGRFLLMLYNNELPYSVNMINLLKQQTVTIKIPEGIPNGITTANKTGELDYVQNDVAIVYGDTPYIICVMSENVTNSATAIQSIVDISATTFEYIN